MRKRKPGERAQPKKSEHGPDWAPMGPEWAPPASPPVEKSPHAGEPSIERRPEPRSRERN
jgi:hypothetical protein